jgi:hypothetical protein
VTLISNTGTSILRNCNHNSSSQPVMTNSSSRNERLSPCLFVCFTQSCLDSALSLPFFTHFLHAYRSCNSLCGNLKAHSWTGRQLCCGQSKSLQRSVGRVEPANKIPVSKQVLLKGANRVSLLTSSASDPIGEEDTSFGDQDRL